MARKITRLTDKQIKSTIPKDKEFTLSDGDGLQLRIRTSGTKSWQFKFKSPISGTLQKITLGVYPHLTLANARKKALEYKELISQQINPKEHIKKQKLEVEKQQANTFSNIAKLWFSRKSNNVSANHASREWRTLEKYVLPAIGNIPISSINAPDTIALLRPIENDGKLSTLKRICQSLNQIMDYAVNHGLVHANPLSKIIKVFNKHKVNHYPTIDPEELPIFLKCLHKSERLQLKTKLLILWQLHTMTRPSEAASTKWEEIDVENKIWTIPKEKMKNRMEHQVPLTKQTLQILEQLTPISGDYEYIFPGELNPQKHMSSYTANAAIKRSLGYKGQLVAHGLRAIASTHLHDNDENQSLHIEACLAHKDKNESRRSYNNAKFLKKRIKLLTEWSNLIESYERSFL
ncbi:tyrosine-type recombinase/integrase [Photobacterium leiognathi]|uniref:tyrosine-type recombinase/integrase n=1 Tax=Photobacterium leiognathi TaxID=553611 RepID=UPI002982A943|nr:integrase arm-type DNA-binding domain-containing protein [Photobacterium leiognathi]